MYHNITKESQRTKTTRSQWQQKAGFYVQEVSQWTKKITRWTKNDNNVTGPIMYLNDTKEQQTYQNYQESMATKSRLLGAEWIAMNQK